MAIFEVTPEDRLGTPFAEKEPVARISLNYSLTGNKSRQEIKFDCVNNYLEFNAVDKDYRLATSIAMFGMKLRLSKYIVNAEWNDIEAIALNTYNPNDYLQSEFVRLVAIAKKIYVKKKRGRKDD